MIRKVLLLFIVIILSPGCSKKEKKGTRAWPLEQSSETYFSPRSNHANQDFPVLGLVLLIGGLFIFFLIIISKRSQTILSVEPFFMPHESHKCLKSFYQDLRSAKEKICIASYWVTHSNIIMALIRARKRNVSIEIIFDRSSPNSTTVEQVFRDTGIEFIESNIDSARMHHKFIIVDDNITWVGSANLTGTAFRKNYENMLRIESLETAQRYLVDFRNLMKELEQSKELAKKNKHLETHVHPQQEASQLALQEGPGKPMSDYQKKVLDDCGVSSQGLNYDQAYKKIDKIINSSWRFFR